MKDSTFRATWISAVVPILIGLIALFTNFFTPAWKTDLEKQMAGLKEWANVAQMHTRITKLEDDVNAIKAAACRQEALPSYCQPRSATAPAPSKGTP